MDAISAGTTDDDPHAKAETSRQSQNDDEIPIAHHIVNLSAGQPRNTYTLELAVLLLFFSWNLSGTVFQNQILYQSCTITMNFNETTCDTLINDVTSDEVGNAIVVLISFSRSIETHFIHIYAGN